MILDFVAVATSVVKDTTRKAMGHSPYELVVSALALVTLAACARSTLATGIIAQVGHFLGFTIITNTTQAHHWFTGPARVHTLTWILAGAGLMAFATSVFVWARQEVYRRWTITNMDDEKAGDLERQNQRVFAEGRVERSATTWVMCLCLLAEMHGFPSQWYGGAGVGAAVLGVLGIELVAGRGHSLGEACAGASVNLLFQLYIAARIIVALPVRVFYLATLKPWRGDTADATAPAVEPE